MEHLRNEIRDVEVERNNALCENKKLQNDMYQLTQEANRSKRLLDAANNEMEDIRAEVQQYGSEARQLEELLASKETERLELLKHLKYIGQETATLESSNQMLEAELRRCQQQLAEAENEIMRLEVCVQDKSCVVKSLEGKLQELSCLASQLEGQMQCAREEKYRLGEDLSRCQESLQQVAMQKEALRHQLAVSESCRCKIEQELHDRKGIIVTLQDQLNKERGHSANLEDVWRRTESEMQDECLSNQRLQEQISSLSEKIDFLKRKLQQEQEQNEEFHRNIEDIRKEITTTRHRNYAPCDDQGEILPSTCRRYTLDTHRPQVPMRRDFPRPRENKSPNGQIFPKSPQAPGVKKRPVPVNAMLQQKDGLNCFDHLNNLRNKPNKY